MRTNRRSSNRFLSRRGFLGSLGASAAILPFVPMLESRAAEGPPLRLLMMFSSCGTIHDAWVPSGSVEDFTLGPILSPLEALKDEIIVVDGLRYNSGGAGNQHMSGPSKFTTGTGLLSGGEFSGGGDASSGWGGGTSIDQIYAQESGKQTPFASLELGVRIGGANPRNRLSYAGPNQPIPPESNPSAVFDRLFAEFGQDQATVAKLKAERRSVLDVVKAQTDALEQKIGQADRHKLEAHLEGLGEIEKRLALDSNVGDACEVPMLGGAIDHMATENYPEVTRLQLDMLIMAFACDLTRSSTFMWNGSTSSQTFPWLGFSDSHHDLSHEGDSNDDAQSKLIAINTWYAEQFAYLVDRMAQIPEADGTMLDNTIVVWANELGKGNSHTHKNIPFVMAGGRNAGITPGRFLQFDEVGHNRLLVSVLNSLGFDVDSYGELDDGSGGLPGL